VAVVDDRSVSYRVATVLDVPALTRLVNAAFRVEDFFKAGDRTTEREVEALLSTGQFLVVDAAPATPAACAYLETQATCTYFGMLSVDPAHQGQGYGRRMLHAIEAHTLSLGLDAIEIHVVNLRTELFPLYRKFGYVEMGTMPFPNDGSSTRPCHFVVMVKRLETPAPASRRARG
jgi:ribosomal protein S18 acetylase RimI-like enzyme